jgi:hypothetical protein
MKNRRPHKISELMFTLFFCLYYGIWWWCVNLISFHVNEILNLNIHIFFFFQYISTSSCNIINKITILIHNLFLMSQTHMKNRRPNMDAVWNSNVGNYVLLWGLYDPNRSLNTHEVHNIHNNIDKENIGKAIILLVYILLEWLLERKAKHFSPTEGLSCVW